MSLPDAPIAHEGFFVTHFFTVKDQEKSKDFYVRILGSAAECEGDHLSTPYQPTFQQAMLEFLERQWRLRDAV
jgi:hypothetical protein